jgi:hypothetical protein
MGGISGFGSARFRQNSTLSTGLFSVELWKWAEKSCWKPPRDQRGQGAWERETGGARSFRLKHALVQQGRDDAARVAVATPTTPAASPRGNSRMWLELRASSFWPPQRHPVEADRYRVSNPRSESRKRCAQVPWPFLPDDHVERTNPHVGDLLPEPWGKRFVQG